MKYRRLGKSALQVSELCLGTMNFGPRTPSAVAFDILNLAMDAGINFIDTANQYGGDKGVGFTEHLIGQWLAEDASRRDRLVIATKVHEPMSNDINDRGLSARHIQMACEASLKRLNVDHIDLYQMHHIDRSAPPEEIWQAMDRLIQQGKITYVGSSNFPGWAIARANEKALSRQRLGLVSEQSLYNLIERRVELEVLPACREYGVGLLVWSPLAGGILAVSSADRVRSRDRNKMSGHSDQLQQYDTLCDDLADTCSAVSLAWLHHQPGVSSTVIGPGTIDQLRSVLHVPNIRFDAETLQRIDEIFPPCGPAPEAYAW